MKSVIFDFNGTLFNDSDKHKEAWDIFGRRYGKNVTEEELVNIFLGGANGFLLKYLFGQELPQEDVDRMTLEKEGIYRELCRNDPATFHFVEGTEAFLDFLKSEGVVFTIATGSEQSNVDFYFGDMGLGRWFDREKVVLDDGTFPGKPAPDGYLRAAAVIDKDPGDCVVFEDSVAGVKAAHAAGIGKIVAITTKNPAEKMLSFPGVVAAVPDFTDMITLWKEVLDK